VSIFGIHVIYSNHYINLYEAAGINKLLRIIKISQAFFANPAFIHNIQKLKNIIAQLL